MKNTTKETLADYTSTTGEKIKVVIGTVGKCRYKGNIRIYVAGKRMVRGFNRSSIFDRSIEDFKHSGVP